MPRGVHHLSCKFVHSSDEVASVVMMLLRRPSDSLLLASTMREDIFVAMDHESPSGMPPGMSCRRSQYVKNGACWRTTFTMQMLLPFSRILGSLDVAPV